MPSTGGEACVAVPYVEICTSGASSTGTAMVTSGVLLENKPALTMTQFETRFASLSGRGGHPSSRGDLPCAAPSLAAYKHCGRTG